MGAPLTVNSPTTGQVVTLLDGNGDIIATGVLTMAQGIVLGTSTAPAAAPGSVAIYSPDGQSVAFKGSDGQAISQTVSGNLTVTGNETVGGTLGVTGNTTLGAGLAVTGNETVGGTLGVTGNSTLTGTLTVSGATDVQGFTAHGTSSLAAVLASAVTVTQLTDTGTLAVTGKTTLSEQALINSADVDGALTITQSVSTTGSPGTLSINESAAGNSSIGLFVAGDSTPRYTVSAAGVVKWSAGSGSQDVTVQRSAAGVLGVTGIIAAGSGTRTAGSAPALTPTFSSGVAAQLTDTTRDYTVYLQIGTAGTITLAIGPTSTPANTIINAGTATAGELISYRLPAGWYTEATLTTATLAHQIAIGC